MTEQQSTGEQVTVLVPEQPPQLTPAAARALLRLLLNTVSQATNPDTEDPR